MLQRDDGVVAYLVSSPVCAGPDQPSGWWDIPMPGQRWRVASQAGDPLLAAITGLGEVQAL